MKHTAPKILGVPMRRLNPQRLYCWTWGAPRLTRHLSVQVFHSGKGDGYTARIWALGQAVCVSEQTGFDNVTDGAAWADWKLRGLVKALRVLEGRQ